MNYISPFRYTLESMALNELIDEEFACEDDEDVPDADISLECFNNSTVCPISTGQDILEQFGFYDSYSYMWMDFGILWGFYGIFCMGTFLALAYLNFNIPSAKVPDARTSNGCGCVSD